MESLRALGEFGLIERFRRRLRSTSTVEVGIGDDAAVLRGPAGSRWLFASDMLVEGVHFRLPAASHSSASRAAQAGRRDTPAQWIGWKALACNISDIAAMGGLPRWAVVSLGLPRTIPVSFIDQLYVGLGRCARTFKMAIVGGDTVRAPQVIIDVAILGSVDRQHVILRRGARVGDLLFVTGRLGGSYRSGRHARFMPRVREAQFLMRRLRVHAMMDLSDGLASDLWQMSRAGGVTLRVEAARIPVAPAARTLQHALMDGEDFELLFAVAPRDARRVPHRIGTTLVTPIGRVTRRGVGVELISNTGKSAPLMPTGFRHF